MVHYGHSNQLRQARAMGDYLIVGVHTDGKRFSQLFTSCCLSNRPATLALRGGRSQYRAAFFLRVLKEQQLPTEKAFLPRVRRRSYPHFFLSDGCVVQSLQASSGEGSVFCSAKQQNQLKINWCCRCKLQNWYSKPNYCVEKGHFKPT